MIFGCSPQAQLPQGQSSVSVIFFPEQTGNWDVMDVHPQRAGAILKHHTQVHFPIPLPKCQDQVASFAFASFSLFPWELSRAPPCRMGAATGLQMEEARGTALGPCYILFQKAIADISTTYTTARDILCYKGFQKHKPPELNTYSMASGALESSGTRTQSLAGAEAMQCLTDRGGNCKSFSNLVSLIVLLDGFAQKVLSVGWGAFFV